MPSKFDTFKLPQSEDRRYKLSEAQRREAISLYEQGYTQACIARKFGVRQSTICYVVSSKARETLRDYRKYHPSKGRTKEDGRLYVRELRNRKKTLLANM